MKRKISFLFNQIWAGEKTVTGISVIYIAACVFLPYLQIFLTKTLVAGIERQYAWEKFVAVFVSIFLLHLLFSCAKGWIAAAIEWGSKTIVNNLLKLLDYKTMTTDYLNVEGMTGQSLRQKALNSVYVFGQSALPKLVSIAINFLGLLFYGITVGIWNRVILFTVILTTLIGYFLTYLQHGYEMKRKEEIVDTEKKLQYLETESFSLQAAREIRLYDMSGVISGLYHRNTERRITAERQVCAGRLYANCAGCFLSCIRNFVAYFYLIHLVTRNQMAISDFVLVSGVVSGLSGWLFGLLEDVAAIRKMCLYMDDYFEYLDLKDHDKDRLLPAHKQKEKISSSSPKLELIQVSFRYEGAGEDTLKNINLTIQPGEKLGIVGKNGAGKTTLIKLLAGLYKPTQGRILLNGIDVMSYTKEEYYKHISAVFQDIVLLPVGILQNVSSHKKSASNEERVWRSLEMAGLSMKVQTFEQGLYTPMRKDVREDAIDLSGGEQQKLMIAKAMYKDSELLILDEPTAALDPISENNIYQKYNELTQKITSFFISHRLISTCFCDRIILLDEGRIIEQGTHLSLLEKKGMYWKMFTLQSQYYKKG